MQIIRDLYYIVIVHATIHVCTVKKKEQTFTISFLLVSHIHAQFINFINITWMQQRSSPT